MKTQPKFKEPAEQRWAQEIQREIDRITALLADLQAQITALEARVAALEP